MLRRIAITGFLAVLLSPGPTPATSAGEPKVEVRTYTYAQLADFIQKNRGKVIVVDMWNLGCPPCIQAMPHLTELHNKYASKGLVVVSLNLDNPRDEENVADVKALLARKKLGAVTNVMLDESQALDRKSTRLNSSHVSISYA